MTYMEYMNCKSLGCRYAADPECSGDCINCIYQLKQDEELGFANNLVPKAGSFIGWKIIRLEQETYYKVMPQSNKKCATYEDPQTRTFTLPDGTTRECRFALVRLRIPEDAKRSSAYGRKCRCSKAQVLDIWPVWLNEDAEAYESYDFLDADHGYSWWNRDFEYHKGETVSAPDFDECWWDECSQGIHFFMLMRDAIEYLKEID